MNKLKKFLCVFLVGVSMTTTVAFAGYNDYIAYKLPRLKGNNYTNAHEKQTNNKYIRNIVTSISGTSAANFWAVDENNKAQSQKYKQNVSPNSTKINFYNSSNLASGQNVKMAMENAKNSTKYGFVSGKVDFR